MSSIICGDCDERIADSMIKHIEQNHPHLAKQVYTSDATNYFKMKQRHAQAAVKNNSRRKHYEEITN